MTDKKTPIAWLPAENFAEEAERKYLDLFSDLIRTRARFKALFYRWNEEDTYELSILARVTWQSGSKPATDIELSVTKKYQSKANTNELEKRGFKRVHPTSGTWTRQMPGTPSPEMIANHLFAGIKYLVDFKPNMGFAISAESNQVQTALNEIASRHQVWGLTRYPDLWFLNT